MRIFTAAALLAALLLLPGLLAGPSLDAAVFIQVASDVRHGETLYVTTWDHKPPGIYLLFAALQAAVPLAGAWALAWLASVLATAGTAAFAYRIATRLGVSWQAATAGAVCMVAATAQYFMSLGGGLTEPFAALALVAAIDLTTGTSSSRLGRSLAIGSLLGVSALFSLQALPGAAAVAALAVLWAAPRAAAGRRIATLAAGAAIPAASVALWLWMTGALGSAFDALVGYPAAYRAVNVETGGSLSTPVLAWTLLALLFLIVPAAMGLPAVRGRGEGRLVAGASIGWVVIAVAYLLVQGRFIAHYAIPLAVPIGLLASFGLDRLMGRLATSRAIQRRLALSAPLVGALVVSSVAAVAAGSMEFAPIVRDHERSQAVGSAIDSLASAGASIFVWGNEPEVYLAADRSVAGPFSYLYPLVTPGYSTPAMVASLVGAVEADPPAVVVDAGSPSPGAPGFQPLLIDRPLASDGRDLDILDPLRRFVSDGYTQEVVVDGWVLYVRREP